MIHRLLKRVTCFLFSVLLMTFWCASGFLLLAQTPVRFAVVGDYGDAPPNSGNVATLIQTWNPDFVITTGDNNYTNPTPSPPNHYPSWDGAVGQYYHQYIKYPAGSGSAWAGSGSATNRFFPSVGNHDWDAGIAGWESYFELPGNERYFDFVEGPVHFFVVSSDPREPDGITVGSVQGQWLQAQLAASSSPWNIVYFHHPPYTSAARGNNTALQWPFQAWGADAVLNGHEHQYERIMKNSFPYVVCGTGGRSLSGFATVEPGSVVRYSANYGAMLVEAYADSVVFRFYSISGGAGGTLVDRYVLGGSVPVVSDTTLVQPGSVWTYLANGSNQGTAWRDRLFDDNAWPAGPAELGYGDAAQGRPEATVVNCGPSFPTCDANNFITTYFRHSFNVVDSSLFSSLTLRILRDDGAVVYLNGTEVFRTNMPTGTILSSTAASTAIGGVDETTYIISPIPLASPRSGTNVIAVEIHQSGPTSSDISFDLELSGTISVPPPPSNIFAMAEPFETLTAPSVLNAHPDWRDDGAGPSVNATNGVAGSKGLTFANDIFTWETHPFTWSAPNVAGTVFAMDFQTSGTSVFDDDRIGWMITNTAAASTNFFGVQLDPDAGTGQNIEAYWDNASNAQIRTTIANVTGLLANTWYRLRLEANKLTSTSASLTVLLNVLDGSGNPGALIASGSIANTAALGTDAPGNKYFTSAAMYPAFTNFNNNAGAVDNAYAEIVPTAPLPIQLASFTASAVNASSVRLDWITLTETNNYGFEVQKSAEALAGYATIPNSFIPGHGTTLEPQTYAYTDNAATAGTWYYRLKQIDMDGTIHHTEGVQVDVLTGVEVDESAPKEFALGQNYPNPFNPVTSIEFHLPKATDVTLKIYNILGSEVLTLLSDARFGSGVHHLDLDATALASGLYIYRMTTPEFSQTRKMIVLK